MVAFRFNRVCVEGVGLHLPGEQVTSDQIEDKLSPIYERLGIPLGALERLSGVRSRYLWPRDKRPSEAGVVAAEEALAESGVRREDIGILVNCSVCRDFFEPATASIIHHHLRLPEHCIALDITNACIGFSNGLFFVGNLIETGVIKAGIVVSPENPTKVIEATLDMLLRRQNEVSREELLEIIPTLTLGCGATAVVLTHENLAKKGHRILGGFAKTASEHNELCLGNTDFSICDPDDKPPIMETKAGSLVNAALQLCSRSFGEALEVLQRSVQEVKVVFPHQIGKQGSAPIFYQAVGLTEEKEYAIYPTHGNMVSAALPASFILGAREGKLEQGDFALMVAFGSGLNVFFTGLLW